MSHATDGHDQPASTHDGSFGDEAVSRHVVVHPRGETNEGVEETADAVRRPRLFGSSRGKVRMAADFDEWPPEYEEFFG